MSIETIKVIGRLFSASQPLRRLLGIRATTSILATVAIQLAASGPALSLSAQQPGSNSSAEQAPVLLDPPRALNSGSRLTATANPKPGSNGSAAPEDRSEETPSAQETTEESAEVRIQPFLPGNTIVQPAAGKPDNQPANPAVGDQTQPATVFITVSVPHRNKAVDSFTAFPYPVKPPKIFKEILPLPTKIKALKGMLVDTGYTTRFSGDLPYPPGGWRWQYAYQAALRHKGGGVPHTILEMYGWADRMAHYIQPEVIRMNDAEERRKERYDKTVAEYQKSYFEIQNDATRKGLIALNFRTARKGVLGVRLPAGTWWIAGSRKLPGLFYYWQIPITLAAGTTENIQLTESNALVIQGGW